MIELKNTGRGFARGEFKDRYGEDCSIQKSSLATEDCIWLGQDNPTVDAQGRICGCRMHLTQEMAADLIPLLQHFVDTGELPKAWNEPPAPAHQAAMAEKEHLTRQAIAQIEGQNWTDQPLTESEKNLIAMAVDCVYAAIKAPAHSL